MYEGNKKLYFVFFKLQSDGLTYFVSEPTSDTQLNAMKGYLDRKGWWYEVK